MAVWAAVWEAWAAWAAACSRWSGEMKPIFAVDGTRDRVIRAKACVVQPFHPFLRSHSALLDT